MQEINIGWQIPLATQGQIVQVLKRTDILKKHGFEAKFVPFSFGSPQVEAARSGALDVIFVGDQPALNLIASGAPWKLFSELFETRVAIMARPNSGLTKENLKGKRIASPFGSVSHREAVLLQEKFGLDPKQDVQNINVDILEIASMVQAGPNWPNVDAVAVWEPSVTLFESTNAAVSIAEFKTLGVAAASDKFLGNKDSAKRIKLAIKEAWQYFLKNKEEVNQWYIDDTSLSYTQDFLSKALSIDRNGAHGDPTKIDLSFTDSDIQTLQNGLNWAKNQGYIKENLEASTIIFK